MQSDRASERQSYDPAWAHKPANIPSEHFELSLVLNADSDPPYYVRDFFHVIETVETHYGNEFSQTEQDFLQALRDLSQPALCLYFRLLNRSKSCYRISKLRYAECEPKHESIAELARCNLVSVLSHNVQNIAEIIVDCFTIAELGKSVKECSNTRLKTKAEYVDWIQNNADRKAWLAQLLKDNPIIIPKREPWQFLSYLFFGHITPNLSAFVVRELGHIKPETVQPLAFERIFASRLHGEINYQHDQHYEQFRLLRETLSPVEIYQWRKTTHLPVPIDETSAESHDKLIVKLGKLLAQNNWPDLAIALYRQCISETCALPLAKLLRKRGDVAEAEAICCERLMHSGDPEIIQQAEILAQRLRGQKARSRTGSVLAEEPLVKIDMNANGVEHAALLHLAQEGWSGIHSENWLWAAFFGLALWDIIYDPAFGGFHNSLQLAPADLWRPEFYEKRGEAIERRIKSFASTSELLAHLLLQLDQKRDVTNPFFRGGEELAGYLGRLCACLPLSGLKATLRRMATDPGQFLRGFPDLFVWKKSEYCFVEVKSENDKLSAHQLAWLQSLNAFGVKARVLRVSSSVG